MKKIRKPTRGSLRTSLARDELCRRLKDIGFSYMDIGDFLCGRSHATILQAVERARQRLAPPQQPQAA